VIAIEVACAGPEHEKREEYGQPGRLRGADGRDDHADREDELRDRRLAEPARKQRHQVERDETQQERARNQPQRARSRIPRRTRGARLDEGQQQRDADRREHIVERDVPKHAPRDGALGLQFVGDEQNDGGCGRDADRRGNGRFQRIDAADEMQQREHGGERQHALGDAHRQQPAVVPRPLQVEPAAEVEHDQAEGELGQHARLLEHRLAQPAEDAGTEQEAGHDVTGDRRKDARHRRKATPGEPRKQQQAEDQERVGGRRPVREECGCGQCPARSTTGRNDLSDRSLHD
jgi:hypothetical protein